MNNGFKKLDLNQYKPLGEVVFDYLRDAIMNGDLKPGERLMESTIADQLGVSRTPVREAIRKLEKEDFVTMVPRKGAYVSKVTAKDILDVLEVRRVLEGFATQLAAERMSESEIRELKKCHEKFEKYLIKNNVIGMIEKDREFHDLIFKASKNEKLNNLVKELLEQFHRFRLIYFNEEDNYMKVKFWHDNIIEGIEKRDSDMARKYAEKHITEIEDAVVDWVSRGDELNE